MDVNKRFPNTTLKHTNETLCWSNFKTNVSQKSTFTAMHIAQYARYDNCSLSTITVTECGVVDETFMRKVEVNTFFCSIANQSLNKTKQIWCADLTLHYAAILQ